MKHVSHFAIVNRSKLPDLSLQIMIEAYRAEIPKLCEEWSLPVPGLAFYPTSHVQAIDEEAAIFVVDSMSDPTAFGMHTVTGKAIWGYVDVALTTEDGEPVSRVFGHELYEATVDPYLDRWFSSGPTDYAIEICDPVQRQSYRRMTSFYGNSQIVECADFVKPSWYSNIAAGPWDELATMLGPLKCNAGGYITTRKNGAMVTAGSMARITSHGRTMRRMMQAAIR